MRQLLFSFFAVIGGLAFCDQGSVADKRTGVFDCLEIAPSWRVESAVRDDVVRWPIALAFDRFGSAWVLEKAGAATKLFRLTDSDGDAVFDRYKEISVAMPSPQQIAVWGDWIYLTGAGQLVRCRLPGTQRQLVPEILLEGFGPGPAYLATSPAGIWVRCNSGAIRQPGQPAPLYPRMADLLLLVAEDGSSVRLVTWGRSTVGPIVCDARQRVWALTYLPSGTTQLSWLNPHTAMLQPWPVITTDQSPLDREDKRRDRDVTGIGPETLFSGPNKKLPPLVRGLVCFYEGQTGTDSLPHLLWVKAWPASLLWQSPSSKSPTALVSVKPAYRESVFFTALAADRQGSIYLAGRYRDELGQAHGFLVRVVRESRESSPARTTATDLARLQLQPLVDRLADASPQEWLAIQEEISLRGEPAVRSVVGLVASLLEPGNDLAPAQQLALIRGCDLLAGRRLPLARPLGQRLVGSQSLQLVLAGIALLRGDRHPTSQALLVQLLGDRNREVWQAAALALAEIGGPEVAGTLANFLRFYDGHEPTWLATLAQALELCGQDGPSALWELANSGSADELSIAVSAWTQLRCYQAMGYVSKWLDHPHLSEEHHRRILLWWAECALHYPADAKPIVQWLEKRTNLPNAVLAAGLQALACATDSPGQAEFAKRWLLHEGHNVRLWAIACFRQAQPGSSDATFLRIVQENARPVQERILAARVLLAHRANAIQPLLLSLLADPSQTLTMRESAAALLLTTANASTRSQLLEEKMRSWPADMWQIVLSQLRNERELILELASRCQQGKLNKETVGPALMEALACWSLEDDSAWQAMLHLKFKPAGSSEK